MTNQASIVRLSEVALVIPGTSPSGVDINEKGEGLPFYQGAKEFGTRHPRPERFTTAPVKTAKAGDILLSVRAPVGRVNIANTDCAIGRGIMAVRPKESRDTPYLAAVLQLMGDAWDAHATDGTMFANLSKVGLEQLLVRWPQDRNRIAELVQALDDRIEACSRIAATCDDLLHARWALDFGEQHESPSETLRDLCTSQYGVTTSGEMEPVGPRLLRVTDINKFNWVDWRAVPYCRVSPEELTKYSLNVGDVLVARMADPGKSAIIEVPEPAVFASYLIRLTPTVPCASYFLFGFLKSSFFTDYAEGAASGSVQQSMNAQTILNAPCFVPSVDALHDFHSWAGEVRQGVVSAIKERTALLDLRDFLLPRLVSGELLISPAEEVVEAAT